MGVYPGDGQSERFLAIGREALSATQEHLLRAGLKPLPGKHAEAVLDNAIQGLIRATAQDGGQPADVINALAHSVALQIHANGGHPALLTDFGARVGMFLREIAADSRGPA